MDDDDAFNRLVAHFDGTVHALASAPVASLEEAAAKARFLMWIDEDEQGNQLNDRSFIDRFMTSLAFAERKL